MIHSKIKSLTYKTLLTTRDGHTITRNLAQALVDQQRVASGNADGLLDNLKQHCSFLSTEIVD